MNQTDESANMGSNAQLVEVFGWASDNYSDSGPPAVVINPEASALTLLSWGLGQLEQCNAMLHAIGDMRSDDRDGPPDMDRFTRHFSSQAEAVLRAGIEKLHSTSHRSRHSDLK